MGYILSYDDAIIVFNDPHCEVSQYTDKPEVPGAIFHFSQEYYVLLVRTLYTKPSKPYNKT